MKNVTRPMTVFYVPTPVPSSRPSLRRRDSEDWVEVGDPSASEPGGAASLHLDLLRLRPDPNVMGHLTRPLSEDAARLGPKRRARMTAVHLDVFVEESRAALAKMSGPAMRLYYRDVALAQAVSLSERVGISVADLDHFCENFGNLSSIEGVRSLGRPEILQVAARFLGDSQQPVPSFEVLQKMAEHRLDSIRSIVCALQKEARRPNLALQKRELLGLYRLLVLIAGALADAQVQRLLAPPQPLRAQVKTLGWRVAENLVAGAQGASEGLARTLQKYEAPKPPPR